jgi:hypothetical protein
MIGIQEGGSDRRESEKFVAGSFIMRHFHQMLSETAYQGRSNELDLREHLRLEKYTENFRTKTV